MYTRHSYKPLGMNTEILSEVVRIEETVTCHILSGDDYNEGNIAEERGKIPRDH